MATVRPEWATCSTCEAVFRTGERGPIGRYCSSSCRSKAVKERARSDGRYEARVAAAKARRAAEVARRRLDAARPCPYCEDLMLNPQRLQCGKPDCKRQFNTDRQREYMRRFKEEHGVWYAYADPDRAARTRASNAARPSWRKSNPESALAADTRRRLLTDGRAAESFSRREIFKRDGWICGICGAPVDPAAKHPDPRSASVDHKVPLRWGGEHSRANVQCAHLRCNLTKGDQLPD